MKIGIVAQGIYPFNLGGHEIRIREVGKRLAKNHEVHLYLPSRKNTTYPEEFEGMKIHSIEVWPKNPKFLTSLAALNFASKISNLLPQEDLDIVDVFFYTFPFEKNEKKVIASTGAFYGSFKNRSFLRKIITGPIVLLKILLNKVKLQIRDRVVALSERVQEETISHFGVSEDEIEIIRPGVSESFRPNLEAKDLRDELNIDSDEFIIAFIGRLVKEKGILDLFKAVEKLSNEDVRILIIGEGNLKNKLEKKANQLGLRTKFLGMIDHSDLPKYLNISDLFVLPSYWEIQPYPLSALEAMACGVPTILTNVGMVEEENKELDCCIRVKPGKPEELSQAITKLKKNEDLREKISQAGLEFAENRTWDKVVGKMEKVYQELLGKK